MLEEAEAKLCCKAAMAGKAFAGGSKAASPLNKSKKDDAAAYVSILREM